MTFGTITYDQFKKAASEFFVMAKAANTRQLESGCKALTIMFLGLPDDLNELESHQCEMLLDMAYKRLDGGELR